MAVIRQHAYLSCKRNCLHGKVSNEYRISSSGSGSQSRVRWQDLTEHRHCNSI